MANATTLAKKGIPTTGKTNERPGTRAVVRHVRMSAYKARVVLDLIRGKDVQTADEVLRFSEREAAAVIRKVLRSAVANAEHNDEQIVDDLYVSACFADEGKTLRRMRPRARGRATRIRKRTTHITVVVSRMPDNEIERRRLKEAQRPGSRAARRAGQEAAEQGRRRRRSSRQAEANPELHEGHDHEAAAEEAGIVDQQAAAVDQVEAVEEGTETVEVAEAVETEAEEQGIVVVSVDAPVTAPNAYNLSNNQEEYAYLGASWLFEQLGGEGKVVYMRGIPGHQADTDRDTGFQRALDENPGIEVVAETQTDWDPATGVTQINEILSSGEEFDGIWTSGIDSSIVDALKTAGADWVPVVGADNAGFVQQLLEEEGLEGAAVTNPPAVGGAGVELALRILNGDVPDDKNVLVSPELWENVTEEGKAQLTEAADPDIDPLWPLGLTVEDWTDYSKEEIIACKGPGES